MTTITFDEYPYGTIDPTYVFADNTVIIDGLLTVDGANPTSPVLAGSFIYDAPITVTFENPVGHINFDSGYFPHRPHLFSTASITRSSERSSI